MFPGLVIAVHLVRDACELVIVKTRLISSLNGQRRVRDQHGDNDDDGVIPEAEDEFEPDPIAVCTLTLLFSVDNHAVSSQKHATNPTFVHPPAIRSPNH